MQSTKPTAAALYVRISEDKAGEALGVQRQEAESRAWAERNGWVVAETYVEDPLSASKRSVARPAYERMLADVRAGTRDGILCWDTDRLTRQLRQLADLIDLSQETGSPIGTVSGSLDLSTSPGRLMATILGGVARQEVEHKAERIAAQLKQSAYAGKPTTRKRPFGWTDNTCQTLHPVEAPALQKAASNMLAGKGMRSIATEWNRAGLTTTTGGPWVPVTVRDLMLRWSNAAIPQYQGEPLLDVEGQWTPILDRDTFDALRARLASQGPRPRSVRKYLLSTVLECGLCGRKLRGASGRYKCMGELEGNCSLSILPDVADAAVTNYVCHRLTMLSGADLLGPERARRRATIEAALAKLAQDRQEIAESDLDLKSRIALLKDVEARESALQAESVSMTMGSALGSLIASLSPVITKRDNGTKEASFDVAADNLTAIRERWADLDRDQQRMIAKALGRYVVQPKGRGADRIAITDLHPDLSATLA